MNDGSGAVRARRAGWRRAAGGALLAGAALLAAGCSGGSHPASPAGRTGQGKVQQLSAFARGVRGRCDA
jgi:hypothetical protein